MAKKLTDSEIRALLEAEIRGAAGYSSSELSDQRRQAIDAYHGQPYGNEVEGRSSYVSHDVADTIEWIMPSLMRVFTGGDTIVRFEPQGPEDEQAAQQATDYVNYIFQKKNPGFEILYTWFKDALISKNGFVKVYWEEYTDYKTETYDALTDDEFAFILKDVSEEGILEHTAYPGPMGIVHAVKIRKQAKSGKVCIVPVPPEEVLVNKNPIAPFAKNRFRAHRRRVTVGELIEMGLISDPSEVPADTDGENFNEEHIARFAFDETDTSQQNETSDPLSREVWLSECYRKIDVDGDGIAEERTVLMAGNKILQNVEGYSASLISITPIPMPHKLFGMSYSDVVADLQLLKTTLIRQILDNIYLANNGRYMALDGMVNIDDLLTSRPGGIVRVKTFDAVKPMQPPLLGAPAFNLLEYIDTIKENRTGVTRYNQGLDADSLNKTATGISQIMSASQSRVELIARVFAETGVKDLFYAILENVQKHQDHAQVIRLRNEWVNMDPREWNSRFDLSVTVGLGTGSKEMQLAALTEESQFQLAAMQAGLPIVLPENVYNLRMKALEAKNIKGGDLFYTHPKDFPQPQGQQPDPKMLEVQAGIQADQAKLQISAQKTQAGIQQKQEKMAHQMQMDQQRMSFEREKAAIQADLERQKAIADHQREVEKLEMEKVKLQLEIELERAKAAADMALQREKAAADAQLKRESAKRKAKEPEKAE
jgi:hypothetical protein